MTASQLPVERPGKADAKPAGNNQTPFRRFIFLGSFAGLILGAVLWYWLGGHRPVDWQPRPVPAGDVELAWIHTTTNAATWERFVLGVQRLGADYEVDTGRAFLEETTSFPEIVIRRKGHSQSIWIRWYKLSSEATISQWMQALSQRNPPPIAVVGGGSTDRAVDTMQALNRLTEWNGGQKPLFFLSTATAVEVDVGAEDTPARKLMSLYPGRSFRFCFNNRQMMDAILDFQEKTAPTQAAIPLASTLPLHCYGSLGFLEALPSTDRYAFIWLDDPYSKDLLNQYGELLRIRPKANLRTPSRALWQFSVSFSVGTANQTNATEDVAVRALLADLRQEDRQRSPATLLLPTVTAPARRVLKALTGQYPLIGREVTVLTGDAIPFNTFYRDGVFAWNVRDLPVPVVFFLHENPIGWETGGENPLEGPSSTEDILLYRDMLLRISEGIYGKDGSSFTLQADVLRDRLKTASPLFFDEEGNRLGGEGEYIVQYRPIFLGEDRIAENAELNIWQRIANRQWRKVDSLSVTGKQP